MTYQHSGPPSGQGERDGISRLHFPGCGIVETPLHRWPVAKMGGALEALYGTGDEPGPRHHFRVVAHHTAEMSDDTVALVANVAHCVAPNAMMPPREGWEGQQHTQTPAALLIARCVELGGSEVVYLD